MGSAGTQNPLYDDAVSEKAYRHISVLRPLAQVDFDAVRIVEKDLEPTVFEADWLDALVIAADFFQRATKYVTVRCIRGLLGTVKYHHFSESSSVLVCIK